ncbi:free fatty acid receptor 2-like [Xyrauchen texanus]|uniref:free fatty acid receptor 2-like n=1 Tax=Xyrauchen texanus TaxID=154827 RepID=UPI0022424E97|nr:free fatty acid receptor 2-like [Xyrauchen texanus]
MVWTVSHRYLVLSVYGLTLVTGLPTNILAFYTFCQKIRQRSTPIDVLLLSLNISDLIFLFVLPFRMVEAANMKWTLPYFLCPLYGFIFYTTIHNSTLHLMAISVDRYLGVAFPIRYKLNRNPQKAVIASIGFWVVSMAHCSIIYFMQYHQHLNPNFTDPSKRNSCYEEFSPEQLKILLPFRLELFVVLFCMPFLICCFCYIKCIQILFNLPNISSKKRIRAIGVALATLLVFIICFMPFSISHVVGYAGNYSPEWRVDALLISTFNASLDPFIFYFSSSALREILKNVLQKLVKRLILPCCSLAFYCPLLNRGKTEERTQSSNESFR